jgi:transcriptional regulator
MPTKKPDHSSQPELLQGTLDVMILRTLDREPKHGYAIARSIEAASGRELLIEEGSLYPALHRLEKRGDIAGEWMRTEQNRRARIYRITPRGKKRLAEQLSGWEKIAAAVSRVLAAGPEGSVAGEGARP